MSDGGDNWEGARWEGDLDGLGGNVRMRRVRTYGGRREVGGAGMVSGNVAGERKWVVGVGTREGG